MNNRIEAMEYIRGLAMLGVVAIHTGSLVLLDPAANPQLVALLEIVSRFSVPIFFFISAFSLFRQYPLEQPLDLKRFYKRRFFRVLLPYIAGSILYMLHYSWLTGDWSIWFPILVYQFFFFGMGIGCHVCQHPGFGRRCFKGPHEACRQCCTNNKLH